MGMEHNLTKGIIMATNMNIFKLPTHGMLKDTQDQDNINCGVRPSENASQVITSQPIFTNLVNEQISAKTIGHGSIIRNRIFFLLKAPLKNCKV